MSDEATKTPEQLSEEDRLHRRKWYIKTHAPPLLLGMLATCDSESELPEARKVAIEQAGLLFDEIEAL